MLLTSLCRFTSSSVKPSSVASLRKCSSSAISWKQQNVDQSTWNELQLLWYYKDGEVDRDTSTSKISDKNISDNLFSDKLILDTFLWISKKFWSKFLTLFAANITLLQLLWWQLQTFPVSYHLPQCKKQI